MPDRGVLLGRERYRLGLGRAASFLLLAVIDLTRNCNINERLASPQGMEGRSLTLSVSQFPQT